MRYALRLTEAQQDLLRTHLFPGDGNEAVALLLCGRRNGSDRHAFCVRKILPVPHSACSVRTPDRITWPTTFVDDLLSEAYGKAQAIVKIHSHPGYYRKFSSTDDQSDQVLFGSISNLLGDALPHGSVVMLPDGEMFGRVLAAGEVVQSLSSITFTGSDLRLYGAEVSTSTDAFALRHAQAFGKGTTALLRALSIAVVGCSGTGSIVIEQLARLGVGRLVLVDPDRVEEKNLNRILNSEKQDAFLKRHKVHVLASAIARTGLGQEVLPLPLNLATREAVLAVAECDIAFGCMDGVEGRHLLNRIATFYSIPYFDVGVRLDADGKGGISSIAGAVHYLQPGRSSLLSREVYTMKQVEAEELKRTNPELYAEQRRTGYLRGVDENRPAVISVNMLYASLAVNEFLARLHPYRNQPNSHYSYLGASLSEVGFYPEPETADCLALKRHLGRGDVDPLLERPSLS